MPALKANAPQRHHGSDSDHLGFQVKSIAKRPRGLRSSPRTKKESIYSDILAKGFSSRHLSQGSGSPNKFVEKGPPTPKVSTSTRTSTNSASKCRAASSLVFKDELGRQFRQIPGSSRSRSEIIVPTSSSEAGDASDDNAEEVTKKQAVDNATASVASRLRSKTPAPRSPEKSEQPSSSLSCSGGDERPDFNFIKPKPPSGSKRRSEEDEMDRHDDDDRRRRREVSVSGSDFSEACSSNSSRGRSSRQAAVNAKRRIVTKEMELTSSDSSDDEVVQIVHRGRRMRNHRLMSPPRQMEYDWDSLETEERAQSPEVPKEQYEIEDVLDFVREEYGDMYLIKWKRWEPEFNTWEPPANLLNCDQALLNFYRRRKAQVEETLANSEYVMTAAGKRRRKGPPLLHVPPDPRSFEVRVQEFCDITQPISDEEIMKVYPSWIKQYVQSKGKDKGNRWPIAKVNRFLQDGVDGKLSSQEMRELRAELVYVEMDRRRMSLAAKLKEWQTKINTTTQERPMISVENDVDFEGPPEGFEFVNEYIPSAGITIPSDPPVGCGCSSSCYDSRSTCCAQQFGSTFAYTKFRKLNVGVGTPIYECNRKCKCGPDCPNRVVQDGKIDLKLSIFRTGNGKGWGVKTLKSIKRGCFVTLYVGEVIYAEEAENRAKQKGDGHTYLFDLDFNDQENPVYSVDASKFGNIAHFINHSCDPNLGVYAVWVDCLDPNLPKLAFFANRDIAKGEEISFDYTDQLASDSNKSQQGDQSTDDNEDASLVREPKERKKCLCGTAKCRKFLF